MTSQPRNDPEGYRIALERIQLEAKEKKGFLNLGGLGLVDPPEELFELRHLHTLALGSHDVDEKGNWKNRFRNIANGNTIGATWNRLSYLANLSSLHCYSTQVRDLTPLSGLTNMRSLNCYSTQVRDLTPLSDLTNLRSLDCSFTNVSDLAPLSGLTNLSSLNCFYTQVSDLAPLSDLTNLRSLDCSFTDVSDLGPLYGLMNLSSLDCRSTQVSDLAPLSGLTKLSSLDCRSAQVSDLTPLSGLLNLSSLYCNDTPVSDLAPLSGLTNLSSLYCSSTQVSDLAPLSGLTNLRFLNCSSTQVSDLAPLSGLTNLSSLFCSSTQVSDLNPLTGTAKNIYARNLRLSVLPIMLIQDTSLESLYTFETTIPGIPQEVLSKGSGEDCLPKLRAHLADIEHGTAKSHDIKLIVVGNGRIGKTQIARRLQGLVPEPNPDSTHGITICSFDFLTDAATNAKARIHLWDFGGQDIYHGTHALFMRTNAVFLLVWANSSEQSSEHEYQGMTFRNYRLPYWLEHIGHLAGYEQPVLVVQNQCDTARDELSPQIPANIANQFQFLLKKSYSALQDRGRAGLDEALREAIANIVDRRGAVLIGIGRAAVKQKLDTMRQEDSLLPEAERRYRTLSMDQFRQICEEAGNISSVELFLEYLHDCGLLFYRPGMFDNQIILDQAWALQAIYTVLDRSGPYKALRSLNGRFCRSLLAVSVWQKYSAQEQKVFLSMMESCGICFIHKKENEQLGIEAEYVAPDLLPTRLSLQTQIASQWEHPGETVKIACDYTYDDPSLTRSIIAEIGRRAQDSALYWRYGACGYDLDSASHFLIEHHSNATPPVSQLTIECRGPRAAALSAELKKLVDNANSQYGMRDMVWSGDLVTREPHRLDDRLELRSSATFAIEHSESKDTASPRLRLGPERKDSGREHFVSYAWGDDSPEGVQRTEAIEQLCAKAKVAGIEIIRDSTHMEQGDRISKFMDRIGGAQRVFVILSQKYLESEFCMYELWAIWKNCQQDRDRFLKTIQVYKLPCAQISKTSERLSRAAYWRKQKDEIDALVKDNGLGIVGELDLKKYRCMQEFVSHTSDMLSLIADVLKAKSFDDLLKQGFEA